MAFFNISLRTRATPLVDGEPSEYVSEHHGEITCTQEDTGDESVAGYVHAYKLHAGVVENGFLSLWFVSLIVAFHNVWDGLPTVVTLLGWAQVLKGLVAFVLPEVAMRGLERVSPERAWEFVAAGIAFLALTAVFWYIVLTR